MSGSSTHAPLLPSRDGAGEGSDAPSAGGGSRAQTTLAAFLGRATGRRGPSLLVRETAARELEERRADWGYSKPIVALDMLWNMGFVVVSVVMLILTVDERPNAPIRVWICGYALQCLVHVALVWMEYRRRVATMEGGRRARGDEEAAEATAARAESDDEDGGFRVSNRTSFTRRWESINTMGSFLWWMVGFYWVVSGGELLVQNAPWLYWSAVVFLAFDVFFAIFCVLLACLIGIALCCCLPCIIAILYTVAGQGGASDADLSILSKYKFIRPCDEKSGVASGVMVPVVTSSGNMGIERALSQEDAECCICLSCYEDGAELHTLPCNHHFHSTCITKWLKMNATCPLCKYDILKGNGDQV